MAIDAGRVVAVLELDTGQFSGGLKTARSLIKTLRDDSLSASAKISAVGEAIRSTGKVLSTSLTLPIVAAGTAATKTFTDFDDAMRQVQATMGLTGENGAGDIVKLTEAAKEMGATTRYTASQAAEALNYLALAGYNADKAIAALPSALRLAQAGNIDLGRATDMVTDSMSALGIATNQLSAFVDEMAKTSQKSNTNIAQLGEGILTVGGTAKSLKGGTVELNTALGILADNGIKGAEGGTALRNMLLTLQTPVDKAAKAMKQYGLNVYDANGEMRGLNEIFADLDDIMEGWTQQKRDKLIGTLFNREDMRAAEALLANYGERWNELSGYISDAQGTAEQMAQTMEGGIGGSFRNLSSAVEGLAIEFGENLAPSVQGVADWVTELARGFTALPEATQTNIVSIAAWTAAVGPALMVGGKLISTIGSLSATLGPAGLATSAIMAAGGIVMLASALSNSGDSLERALRNTDPREVEAFQKAFEGISTNVELNAMVTDNAGATVDSAVQALKEKLLGIDILTDKQRDEIVSLIGQDIDPILAALQGAGIDTSTESGATAAAQITAAATQLNEALVSAANLGEGLDLTALSEQIEADKQAIMNALVASGAEPEQAETAAQQILDAKEALAEACAGFEGIVPEDIASIIAGQKSTMVTALTGLGLSEDEIAGIVTALATAQSTLEGQVTSLYDAIFSALTDGEPDTAAQSEDLKAQAQAYYDELMGKIELDTQNKLGALEAALSNGTITLDEYNTQAQAVINKNSALVEQAQGLLEATTTYIDEMSGRSTSAVEAAQDRLEAIRVKSAQLYGEIMAMTDQADQAQSNQSVRMVRAGVTTAPERVAEAFGATYQEYAMNLAAIREQAAEARKQADDAWDQAYAEADQASDVDQRKALRDAADKQLKDSYAVIEQTQKEQESRVTDQYKAGLNALFSGMAAAMTKSDPETVAKLRELLDAYNLWDRLFQILENYTPEELNSNTDKARKVFTESILQALGFNEGFDPNMVDTYLSAASQKTRELMDNVILPLEDEIADMDTGVLGLALDNAIQQGLLESVEGIDVNNMRDKLALLLGEVELPVEIGVGSTASGTEGESQGARTGSAYAQGLEKTSSEASHAGAQVAGAASKALDGEAGAARAAGANIGEGFAGGIDSKMGKVIARAAALARAAINAINSTAEIASPSKASRRSGRFVGEGFGQGLLDRIPYILDASQRAGAAGLAGFNMAPANLPMNHSAQNGGRSAAATGAASQSITLNVNNPAVRSDQDIRKLAREINRYSNHLKFGMGGR